MTPLPHSDEVLMQRYCEGDVNAFAVAYRRHGKDLYQFIAWRSPRCEWVEEITQITATSVKIVKSRLRYAMQKLRSKLAPPTASLSGERA